MTHTPGPWTASQYMDTPDWGVITDENRVVVGLSSRITADDARLIAAAPDLLQALIHLVIESESVQDMDDAAVNRNFGQAIENALKALKRAKGQS
jgi:hypothetical protein